MSSLAFCDLAGSERAKKMGAAVSSKRIAESKTINQSLMQLRIVIADLQKQQRGKQVVAIPFRNSKLTRLMQAYLVGNSKTSIIVAVSNNPSQFEETQASLQFASTAKSVQLGLDRHGKALKESDKFNISYNPPKESLERTDPIEAPESNWSSDDGDTYEGFTREDFIGDLNYYKEREAELIRVIHTLKTGWQRDEAKWKELQLDMKEDMKDLRIDLANQRIQAGNDRAQANYEWSQRLEKKNEKMRELRRRIQEGVPDESLAQRNKELSDEVTELSSKIVEAENVAQEKEIALLQVRDEIDLLKKQLEKYSESDAAANAEITALVSQQDHLRLEIKSKEDEIDELRAKQNRSRQHFEQQINDLTSQLAEAQEKESLSPIGSPVGPSSIVPLNCNETAGLVTGGGDRIFSEIEKREQDVMAEEIESLKQKLNDAVGEKKALQRQFDEGKNTYTKLLKQKATLEEQVCTLQEKIDGAQREIVELQGEISGLKLDKVGIIEDSNELKSELTAKSTANARLHIQG